MLWLAASLAATSPAAAQQAETGGNGSDAFTEVAPGFFVRDAVGRDTIGVRMYFRRGYSRLEPAFRDNAQRLEDFMERLRQARQDSLCHIKAVHIVAAASPEGITASNNRLARKRSTAIDTLMRRLMPHEQQLFKVSSTGVDWQGLERMVEASDMPYRDEVLHILRNTPEWIYDRQGRVIDGRKRQLGMLRGGRPWGYMEKNFFPELRAGSVSVYCEIERVRRDTVTLRDTLTQTLHDTVVHTLRDTLTQTLRDTLTRTDTVYLNTGKAARRPFYLAVKTNLLYDALAMPNIGVEVYLKNGWTLGANWMYAWWKNDSRHRYWRTYGGDLAIRKYLGRRAAQKPLQGHHLGLYGQLLTYDLEWGGRGYLGDRWSWGAGLEYGYSLPLARRLNMDFTIGLGYLGGEYQEYLPIDDHYVWQSTKQRRWFGPTKAEISLVWLLGRGNHNAKKGGKQ